jgi:NAD(P)-dependent dehydrogenase (short-subunit alcohol dehydrogenase family)
MWSPLSHQATPASSPRNSEMGDGYRRLIAASSAKRMAPRDEVAIAAGYLLGPDAAFVNGSDLPIDRGVMKCARSDGRFVKCCRA